MRSARHATRTREKRDNYRVMVAKSEGKGPIGISRSGWDDNIKMDRQEIKLEQVAGSCNHGKEPSLSIKCR
jgi:hypothetical protein